MKTSISKQFYFHNNQKLNIDFDCTKVFNRLTKITAKVCKIQIKTFSVSLISATEMREINKKYRNINKITDVISFCFKDNNCDTFFAGEMYICIEQAIKQAKSFNHSLKREICFLFVHGLLHILGYNHSNLEEERIMFSLQDEILKKGNINK